MSLALEAIVDIENALAEYGSDITLNKVTKGAFNPLTGETTDVVVQHSLKAFIKMPNEVDILKLNENILTAETIKFSFYFSSAIKNEDTIVFHSKTYKILGISSSILQNEVILYNVLARVS